MKTIVLVLLLSAIAGCQTAPWYAKLEARNPQCVQPVKPMTCKEFIDLAMALSRSQQEQAFWAGMLNDIDQNLTDLEGCPGTIP